MELGVKWWRCLHCGHDKYVPHHFVGALKGARSTIDCAACGIMHTAPDPNSKSALRYRIAELEHDPRGATELRERVALLVEGYQWDSGECETEARNIADAILAIPEIREALILFGDTPAEDAKHTLSPGA